MKQLNEETRKLMLDTADVWWQEMVDGWVWQKECALGSYLPVCSYGIFRADVDGTHRAHHMNMYNNMLNSTTYPAEKPDFKQYLMTSTGTSSWMKKDQANERLSEDQLLTLVSMNAAAGCHGSFPTEWKNPTADYYSNSSRTSKIEDFMVTSCADYMPEHHNRQKVLDFLLGTKSPYKQLLDCGFFCHYYKDGRIAGVSIFIEDVPEELRHNIKNFFIALRQAREHPVFADIFSEMVDNGADPRVAFLAAAEVKKSAIGDSYVLNSSTAHNGGHWPLSIMNDVGFSVARFFTGDINVKLGSEQTRTSWGIRNPCVNSTFGDTINPLSSGDWLGALIEGADVKENKSLYSKMKVVRYTSLKKLAEVATNFLISKGAVL